ncbi:hypothetical protein BDZ91DRAFT_711164 [Kalaharituber pfeilii]|nr:hypothetical protein BDZ91DRAFT_711164 [Kalaharituber pfeilii]
MGKTVHLLDTVSGNIRSLVNAIEKLGYEVQWIRAPEDFDRAESYISSGKPFMGICVGQQALFAGSEEDPGIPGLGIFPGTLRKFNDSDKSVPHIGWNSAIVSGPDTKPGTATWGLRPESKYYYVHSYAVPLSDAPKGDDIHLAVGTYHSETFIGAISKGNIFATQFHPEKSGVAGLRVLKAFLDGTKFTSYTPRPGSPVPGLTRRIIACLDVRANDDGDLVVTKGDQYDVREKATGGNVRNLGKPVSLAEKYYLSGADEITFLNITSFRNCPLADIPMLEILRLTSFNVFVPLTIGGGIRDVTDPDGTVHSALKVAAAYFSSGADKVSIGSDAVLAAEAYYARGRALTGASSIEQISAAYGNQAVVVSIDPRRVYIPTDTDLTAFPHDPVPTAFHGPNGETHVWYQTTIKGGREARPLSAQALARAVEAMGAGEILLNSIDRDGSNAGFDLELVRAVKAAVKIPVIASSGAGVPAHFTEVFERAEADAALGAGMFHRGEYEVWQVKEELARQGLLVREPEGAEV